MRFGGTAPSDYMRETYKQSVKRQGQQETAADNKCQRGNGKAIDSFSTAKDWCNMCGMPAFPPKHTISNCRKGQPPHAHPERKQESTQYDQSTYGKH